MAKKIQPDQETTTVGMNDQQSSDQQVITNPIPLEVAAERSPFIDEILRTHAGYEALYIDMQGGTYTLNTPCTARGNAILYTNPFYKSNILN